MSPSQRTHRPRLGLLRRNRHKPWLEELEERRLLSTFSVNLTADVGDATAVDGLCDSDLTTLGDQCTLRAAIEQANSTAGTDSVEFNIPTTDPGFSSTTGTWRISPSSPLPEITDSVIINGYSQPGASPNTLTGGNDAVLLIELNGSSVGGNGLRITAGSSTASGLVINGFGNGIRLEAGGGNLIEGNFLGTDVSGAQAQPNSVGLLVDGSPNNTVGGTVPAARNVISGNSDQNLFLIHGASGNQIQGNFVGPNASGTASLPGLANGVIFLGAPNNVVGGTAPGAGNLISGNAVNGVQINGSDAGGNVVQGNLIGTDITGTQGVGNGSNGVLILNAA